jgi:DNA-binding MarR family transcriptional regulator
MSHTRSGEVFTALILEVFRLNGRLLAAGEALARPAGQTSARWQVLGALDPEARTVADIGRRMGLTRQSVQRTADRLDADGLVSYVDNPGHRRAKLVRLTARGSAALESITRRQVQWANQIGGRLVERELADAVRTLERVRAALDVAATATRPAPSRPSAHRTRRNAPPRSSGRS